MVLRTVTQTCVPLAAEMVYSFAVKGAHALSTLLALTLPSTVHQQAYGIVISAPKIEMHSRLHSLGFTKRYSATHISKTQSPTAFLKTLGTTMTESRPAKTVSTRNAALSKRKPHSKYHNQGHPHVVEGRLTRSRTRGGYEEQPNNFRLKDAKEGTILCFRCSGSSLGRDEDNTDIGASHGQAYRQVIQCDHCNLFWHLDCLDPPLAVPPKKSKNNRARATWMCPNHIDLELNNIDFNVNASHGASPTKGRKYKVRRPKVVSIIDIALRRGFKNNGLIEIENESSDEEDIMTKPSGQILRVPETGIKLDFIDRIKR
jgi:hypothetical protein